MARRFLILLGAFAAMVAGIEGLHRAVDWWRGVLPAPTLADFVLMGCLPLSVWLWWRYASPFARSRGQCLAGNCASPVRPTAGAPDAGRPAPSSHESRDTESTGR